MTSTETPGGVIEQQTSYFLLGSQRVVIVASIEHREKVMLMMMMGGGDDTANNMPIISCLFSVVDVFSVCCHCQPSDTILLLSVDVLLSEINPPLPLVVEIVRKMCLRECVCSRRLCVHIVCVCVCSQFIIYKVS